MSGGYTAIDISRIAAPPVVEALDYETVLAELVQATRDAWPEFDAEVLESDPAMKLLQVAAYRELILRQRINDAARACMVATATGADLDNLAALVGVGRLLLDAGDPDAIPPVPPTYESDEDLRRRVPLSLEGVSTAGPEGSYVFHAMGVAGVRDVAVASPVPGEVVVTILSRDGNGAAGAGLIAEVQALLDGDDVRPLTDQVTVQGATIIEYTVQATIYTQPGPDSAVVLDACEAALGATLDALHAMGRDVPLSAIYGALHQPGVQRVELASPLADIAVGAADAAYCTGVTLADGGIGDA